MAAKRVTRWPTPFPSNPASLDADYFEVMTRAVFQAGVSWKQIAAPWDAYREAFARLRSRRASRHTTTSTSNAFSRRPAFCACARKVRATIANASALLEAEREHDGFAAYLRSFDSYSALAKDFKRASPSWAT